MQVEKKPGWKRGMKVATHPSYYHLTSERARYLVRMPPSRRYKRIAIPDDADMAGFTPDPKAATIDRGMRKFFVLLARVS